MMPRLAPPKNRQRRAGSALQARETAAAMPDLEARAAALLEARRGKATFRAPPQAGALAARIIKPLIPAGTKTLSELRRQWPEIVGDKLAQLTAPAKLTKGPDGEVLTLTVAGSAAPFVQHQTPLILERLRLAGCAAVALTMKQGALPKAVQANVRPLTVPLSAEAEKALNSALAPIDDDRLRAALLRLGRAVGAPKSR
jgi:hypothetical protein